MRNFLGGGILLLHRCRNVGCFEIKLRNRPCDRCHCLDHVCCSLLNGRNLPRNVSSRILRLRGEALDLPRHDCKTAPSVAGTRGLDGRIEGEEIGLTSGRVEMAHRGTLFLDEISELDPSLQSKLLQLLQDGQFCRIGAQEDKKVEVRVVCATNRQLEAEIEAGTFRQDLYYRINVVNIRMPSLRERRGDIDDLCTYFLEYYNRKFNCRARPLSNEVLAVLQKYHWPGNIRELENLIKRYVILGHEEVITNDLVAREPDFFNQEISLDGPISLKKLTRQCVRELERKVILKVLQQHHWNRKQAARTLGISYRALL